MIAIAAAWTFLKNSKVARYILAILACIITVSSIYFYEVHSIKSKQKLVDELNQQKQLTLAVQEQEKKDKAVIDAFNSTVGINALKEDKQKETVKQIIKDNPIWANTPLPDGVNEEVNQ